MQETEYFKNNIKNLQKTLHKIRSAEHFNESMKKTVGKCLQALLDGNTLYLTVNGG